MTTTLDTIGMDVHEHKHIDEIYPLIDMTVIDTSELIDIKTDPHAELLENIRGVLFPTGKNMWPVMRFLQLSGPVYTKTDLVRSVKDVIYTPNKILSIVNDERGSWVFVKHINIISDTQQLCGFITTLSGVLIQEYGNVPPISIPEWGMKYIPTSTNIP